MARSEHRRIAIQGDAMTSIDLIYFNAGGGHRAAALALEAVCREQQRPWDVRRVNLFEVLDPGDRFRRVTGMAPEELYNRRLEKGWTLGLAQELKLLQGMIRLGHATMVRRLRQHWLRTEPDLIVSLVPNFNRAMCQSAAEALPGVPYVTVLTDLADFPPNFWIEPGLRQHLVCGTAAAVAQARAAGVPEGLIHPSSGMIVRPDFYRPPSIDRRAERERLGLDPDRPTGIVMFGAAGSLAMLDIAQQLDAVQLILMCGRHRTLPGELRQLASTAPRAIVEFTPEVRRHMALADFFIGKPGPGSLSEAAQQQLPVLTFRNAWTLPQERYNAEWVRGNGLGLVVRSTRHLAAAVDELLQRLPEFQANVRSVRNRAVFEIPDILASVLADGGGGDHAKLVLNQGFAQAAV